MSGDLQHLFSYIDGTLPPEAVREVETRLKVDRAFADLFILACRDEAVLWEWSATVAIPGDVAPFRSPRRAVRRVAEYLTAAAVLVAAGVAIYSSLRPAGNSPEVANKEAVVPESPIIGRLEDVQGETYLVAGGDAVRAHAGQEVRAGQTVRTSDGAAVVRLSDMTRLELGTETRVAFMDPNGIDPAHVAWHFASGFVRADVPSQVGRPVTFSTPHTTVRADAARFSSMAMDDVTGFETESGQLEMTTSNGDQVSVPEGRFVVAGQKAGDLTSKSLPDRVTTARDTIQFGPGPLRGVKAVPGGTVAAINTWEGIVVLHDYASGKRLPWAIGHQKEINDVAVAVDGKLIATASQDRFAKLRRVDGDGPILQLRKQRTGLHAVALSPDNRIVVTAAPLVNGADVIVWNAETGAELGGLSGHPHYVDAIAFHPNGAVIATACRDGMLRVWDAMTFKLLETHSAHRGEFKGLAFSPDGKTLATAGRDGLVRLWDTGTWMPRATLEGHLREVESVTFSADGRLLATAGGSTTIWLWNVETGAPVRAYIGHKYKITGVAFSPDGRTLLSSGWDRTVKLWDVRDDLKQ